MLTLAKVIQTCAACPSQWDAWTEDGTYVYLRYRHGLGTVEVDYPNNSAVTAQFDTRDDYGHIELADFIAHVADKVRLAHDTEYVEYWQHLRDQLGEAAQ